MVRKIVSILLMGTVSLGLLISTPVQASKQGRRNTAIGVSALALQQLLTGHTTTGIIAGAGAAYAWSKVNKHHNKRWHNHRDSFYEGYKEGAQTTWQHRHEVDRHDHH